jgi:GntR family transcriptional regulator, transcriptional repressor for pyruvate dehydrogenase complex
MNNESFGRTEITRVKLSDTIYQRILEEIVGERYAAGDRLPTENEIAQVFGVSRPVVRQALGRLQTDGLVVSRRGSGTFVQRKPQERVIELTNPSGLREVLQGFELRITLEGLSARLAASNRTEQQLQQIEEAAAAVKEAFALGLSRDAAADYAFHREIAQASGNVLLVEVLELISEKVKGGMRVTHALTHEASEQRRARVLDEHDRILHAIRVQDAEAANVAMTYHVHQAKNRLLDGQLDR